MPSIHKRGIKVSARDLLANVRRITTLESSNAGPVGYVYKEVVTETACEVNIPLKWHTEFSLGLIICCCAMREINVEIGPLSKRPE
jgi:hypothetical protein